MYLFFLIFFLLLLISAIFFTIFEINFVKNFLKIENTFVLWLLPVFSTLGMMLAVWLSTHIDHKSKVFCIKLILITLLINLLLRSF